MKGEFDEMVSKFPGWLEALKQSPALARDQFRKVPNQGVYVFFDEQDQPLYVGRSDHMRARLQMHSRPGSGHESASFAFMLAKENTINTETVRRSRKDLQMDKEFSKNYFAKKDEVSKMKVRVIEIIDPAEQALFEIYASLEMNTPYNVWENH